MYNLANLNDYEFEVLCKDIMEKKLSTLLHRFGKGKDGGIDLCDSKNPIQYMIQVKHYINSKYSDLRTALKKEIAKVEIKNPQNYYVCCSIELSPQQRREIVSLFPKYMKDISFVIDKTEIDDFLSKEENKDIVEKHYKLWLCSSNVLSLVQNQHVFIDCNEILNDIEKYTQLFITTKAYFECRNKLLDGNIIIIIGTPGVGKSTISKMLLLFFASNDYIVRYITDNNIKDIKNVLTQDPSKKEIILLDDFLGQHYLNLTDKQPNELKTLISFVERNPNKKIILNSRIIIINEAYSSSINFANLIEEYEKDNYLIDLDKMSELEKAEILYNHLYFNELPQEYLWQIKTNKNYAKIIKHKNYNPRIIEYITKPKNYTNIPPEDYIDYVLSKLNNPDSVWEDEFRNRLEENDRILMNTIYSLTNTKIEINVLRNAFNKRLLATIPSTTINTFEEVISRLSNSLIQVVVEKEKRYISVINPSVNDYLKKKIETNENEQLTIINNSKYIEQIMKFMQNKKRICEIIYNNELEEISSVDKSPSYYYLKLIIDYELKDMKLIEFIALALENICLNFS
ncbi:MAG: restriction endonuclease [Bacilli bacterium]